MSIDNVFHLVSQGNVGNIRDPGTGANYSIAFCWSCQRDKPKATGVISRIGVVGHQNTGVRRFICLECGIKIAAKKALKALSLQQSELTGVPE